MCTFCAAGSACAATTPAAALLEAAAGCCRGQLICPGLHVAEAQASRAPAAQALAAAQAIAARLSAAAAPAMATAAAAPTSGAARPLPQAAMIGPDAAQSSIAAAQAIAARLAPADPDTARPGGSAQIGGTGFSAPSAAPSTGFSSVAPTAASSYGTPSYAGRPRARATARAAAVRVLGPAAAACSLPGRWSTLAAGSSASRPPGGSMGSYNTMAPPPSLGEAPAASQTDLPPLCTAAAASQLACMLQPSPSTMHSLQLGFQAVLSFPFICWSSRQAGKNGGACRSAAACGAATAHCLAP